MDIWKQEEKRRLERNNARRIAFHKAMSLWTEECAQAKDEGRRPGWARPKLRKLESPIPNPVVDSPKGEEAGRNGDENEDENNEDDTGNNDGMQSDGSVEESLA
ncbi:hypothetical protein HYDPIDRAFT_161261 [Hydnomerulius pinastri MD-312]|uniref:Uncharacterized protein n=1 Tax=Hydnomerulius pinastri MD-312 TaxID=994086 RepID=A0A0C9WA20_9AGAM|nr:hypothetical protein HYDPIDRAFT_161261 [Hydnomerulius pinastri MD-312]